MNISLPHRLEEIAESIATEVMRGWMELINRSASNENLGDQSAGITPQGSARINATANITVALREDALEDEWVTVRHDVASGYVTITDGSGSVILTVRGTVVTFRYLIDEGWVIGA